MVEKQNGETTGTQMGKRAWDSSGTGMSRGRTVFAAAFRGNWNRSHFQISRRLQDGLLAAQYSTTVVEVGCATVGRFKTIDASALPSWEQQTMDPVREADN